MNSNVSRRLFVNFTALGIVQGANFLLPILIIPYVISKIGADGFGVIAVAQVINMFFTNVADYGFNLTATRDVSVNRENSAVLSKIFFTVLATRLFLCFVLFIVLIAMIFTVPIIADNSTLYLLSFVSVVGHSASANWLFQGVEKMKFVMYISLLARLVFVLLVIFFIKEKNDNVYFLFFYGIGNLLAGIFSALVGYRVLRLQTVMPTFSNVLAELKKGWHITMSNLSVSVYMYVNILILRLFTNDTVVGYYSVAERIIFAARQVLGVYFQVVYPQVCQLAMKSRDELSQFFMKFYRPFLGCVFAGCVFVFLFAETVIQLFINENVELSAQYLRILSPVPLIVCLNIPSYQVLLAHNDRKVLLLIFMIGTFLNIALNLLMIPALGAQGTSYIVVATELFITTCLIVAMARNRQTRVRFVI